MFLQRRVQWSANLLHKWRSNQESAKTISLGQMCACEGLLPSEPLGIHSLDHFQTSFSTTTRRKKAPPTKQTRFSPKDVLKPKLGIQSYQQRQQTPNTMTPMLHSNNTRVEFPLCLRTYAKKSRGPPWNKGSWGHRFNMYKW